MKKPNIIFILTDDQGYWSLGSYGNKDIISPTLDKLSQEGAHFNNFFCVSPVCSPARASIFTGKIPSQHGIHDWLDESHGDTTEYLKGQETFVNILSQNNYDCCLSGKWHLGNSEHIQQGFSKWFVHEKGGGPYYNAPMYKDGVLIEEPKYITDAITDYGIDFIENSSKRDKPFYLSLHYTAPHAPWGEKDHPQEIQKLYKDCLFNSCPRDKFHPWKIHETFSGNEDERLSILKSYFTSITSIDQNIERVLNTLTKLNLLEDTLIIFTSDNGMNMGHHGIFGKGNGTSPQNMYDTSVKVPMIFYHKGKIKGNVVLDNLYSHYDIFPTLIEYLNIPSWKNDGTFPGKSFYNNLITGFEKDSDNIIIYDEYGPVRMIRNKKWKYIHRYPFGPHEFYSLENDIDEKINLIDDESYFSIILNMRTNLETWFMKYVKRGLDGTKEPVYGGGQKGISGINRDIFNYQRYSSNLTFTEDNILKD